MFPFNFSVEVSWTLYRLDEHAGSDQHAKDSERYSVAGEGAPPDFLQRGYGASVECSSTEEQVCCCAGQSECGAYEGGVEGGEGVEAYGGLVEPDDAWDAYFG